MQNSNPLTIVKKSSFHQFQRKHSVQKLQISNYMNMYYPQQQTNSPKIGTPKINKQYYDFPTNEYRIKTEKSSVDKTIKQTNQRLTVQEIYLHLKLKPTKSSHQEKETSESHKKTNTEIYFLNTKSLKNLQKPIENQTLKPLTITSDSIATTSQMNKDKDLQQIYYKVNSMIQKWKLKEKKYLEREQELIQQVDQLTRQLNEMKKEQA